jgi:CRISPR type III-A-associated RAMP protein Csm4
MNPGLVVKLRPTGPWRIGPASGARNRVDLVYHSDSLYSAVTSAMARLGWLEEWLDATARNPERAAVRFSSCFPFQDETNFIVPPRTVWPPSSPAALAARTRWKSARFVPVEQVPAILAGQTLKDAAWSVDGVSQCLVPAGRPGPFRTQVRWQAGTDRLTGASERWSTACIEFRPGAGLWAVVSFADESARDHWCPRVKTAFRLLADSGFGGERSRGWGRAETPEFIEGELPGMILPPPAPVAEAAPAPVVEAVPQAPAPAPEPEFAAPVAVEPVPEPPPAEPAAAEDSQPEASQPEVGGAGFGLPTEAAEPPVLAAEVTAPPVIEPLVSEAPASEESEAAEASAQPAEAAAPEEPAAEPVAEALPVETSEEPAAVEPEPAVEAVAAPAAEPEPAPHSGASHTAHWLLSLFAPSSEDAVDWERGNYTLLARGGRVESPAGSGELKKQIEMVAEGSVLVAGESLLGAAPDVAPDGFAHPVFRAGFALSIPLPKRVA